MPARLKILLALLPVLAATAAMAQERVTPGQFVAWTHKVGAETIAAGGTQATISAAPCDKGGDVGDDCYRAKVAVTVAGKPPAVIFGEPGIAYRVAIGRLSAGDSGASVVLQSFTGGAHCCDVFTIAEPVGDTVRIVPITWQPNDASEPQTLFDFGDIPFPADLTGDGHADVVLRDDRFLYAFESYAGSMAPPIVLSIGDGRSRTCRATRGWRRCSRTRWDAPKRSVPTARPMAATAPALLMLPTRRGLGGSTRRGGR